MLQGFGFHLAKLDIRQNSAYHEKAINQILVTAGYTEADYANWDEDTWVVAPTPSDTFAITIAYYAQPATITSSDTATNYVSNNASDLLLYGSLSETYKMLKGPADMVQVYEQAYQSALQSFGVEQTGRRRRDEYTSGVIRVPLQTSNP